MALGFPNKVFQVNILKIKGKTKIVRKIGVKFTFKQTGTINLN